MRGLLGLLSTIVGGSLFGAGFIDAFLMYSTKPLIFCTIGGPLVIIGIVIILGD